MLQHVAFAINDPEEIDAFYKNVLHFTILRTFSINENVSETVFNVPEEVDVYVMGNNDLEFEMFITPLEERKVFSHVCLKYRQSEALYHRAISAGYKAVSRKGMSSQTYFIWDRSGNMFEIKEQ
ncbi:MAG: VOC family protein [Bacteroidales bacterium]|nr:VOC family protein [Bacteroidales bacterium]MBN2763804.1 VOC family protein [Bacteroidales bacterium]